MLCYLVPIAGPLIFLLLSPYNRDNRVRFNAWQALFLQLAFFVTRAVLRIFYDVSWRLGDLLGVLVQLIYFGVVIFMAVKAYQDQKIVLPVIGAFADRQK